ncbi:hypothetical protein ABZ733_34665 [Streptomyces longwoodensis]|uniref:hypothetical protein n=1 Tax=Streptomyces longwoodensis TaxID=68231 RepID=UPI0033E2E766
MSPLMRRDDGNGPRAEGATWVREFRDFLDSSDDDLTFTATIRVEWGRPANEPGTTTSYEDAGRQVRLLAQDVAGQRSVLRAEATEQDINYELRRRMPWLTEGIEIVWAQVSLHVDDHTRSTAERMAQLRREAALEELARQQTAARIRFMQDEILRTPATARLYLMLEQSTHHGALPPGIDIEQVVRDVQQWHPQAQWVVVAQLVYAFLANLTVEDRSDLLHTVRALFLEYGEKELAEQLPVTPREPSPGRPA